jgi:hypothetical protein
MKIERGIVVAGTTTIPLSIFAYQASTCGFSNQSRGANPTIMIVDADGHRSDHTIRRPGATLPPRPSRMIKPTSY